MLNDEAGKNVKQRAVDQIMKLIHSQLVLEKKQAKMDAKDKETSKAAGRMADLDETIEKLVAVAKRKGYIDPACTVASLKAEAAKRKDAEASDDAVSLMTAMKKNLDAQTQAVTDFMKDRVNHDADWEEAAWAKLLNSNQDILVLMSRLHERNLITEDMIRMATLPDKPPPPREQDIKGVAPTHLDQNQMFPQMDGSMMGPGNPMYSANSSMMGGMPHAGSMMHPGVNGSFMNGMMPNGMMPNGMMPNGMMPNGMMPGMMPNGMMGHQPVMSNHPNQSFMSKVSKPITDQADSSSNESEEELNARLRELKGMEKDREMKKKLSKQEQDELNLFNKNKGVGHFNNNFKVADDIRLLGAVPEEEEEREVPIDKHMAKAMEERLLKGLEQEMLRDRQAIIRSFMKDQSDSYMGSGTGLGGMGGLGTGMGPQSAASSMMQMQMMQQQNMMAIQQMLMQMNMNRPEMGSNSMMGGPSHMHGYTPSGSMMGMSMNPSMMGQGMHSSGMNGSMMGQPGMMHPSHMQGMGMQMPHNGQSQMSVQNSNGQQYPPGEYS